MQYEINIPPRANHLIYLLQRYGYSAYVVGGCVRDSILGREPHDWDLCTSATPGEMMDVFRQNSSATIREGEKISLNIVATGLKHGTITVFANGEPFEITTFRKDGTYSNGRHPDNVSFVSDVKDDLARRDFTINAMAYNKEEGLIDPFGGREDLENRVIRCVGRPEDRFEEDARKAAHGLCHNIDNLSAERVRNELCKMIICPGFSEAYRHNKEVFHVMLPELRTTVGFEQRNKYHVYTVFEHTLHALEGCPSMDLETRLALLLHDIGKPNCYQDGPDGQRHFKGHGESSRQIADSVLRRLKFDNVTRESVCELVAYHDAVIEDTPKNIRRWLHRIGPEQFSRLLDIREGDIKAHHSEYVPDRLEKLDRIRAIFSEEMEKESCFSLKDLAINGSDLIAMGYAPGKELGNKTVK